MWYPQCGLHDLPYAEYSLPGSGVYSCYLNLWSSCRLDQMGGFWITRVSTSLDSTANQCHERGKRAHQRMICTTCTVLCHLDHLAWKSWVSVVYFQTVQGRLTRRMRRRRWWSSDTGAIHHSASFFIFGPVVPKEKIASLMIDFLRSVVPSSMIYTSVLSPLVLRRQTGIALAVYRVDWGVAPISSIWLAVDRLLVMVWSRRGSLSIGKMSCCY